MGALQPIETYLNLDLFLVVYRKHRAIQVSCFLLMCLANSVGLHPTTRMQFLAPLLNVAIVRHASKL